MLSERAVLSERSRHLLHKLSCLLIICRLRVHGSGARVLVGKRKVTVRTPCHPVALVMLLPRLRFVLSSHPFSPVSCFSAAEPRPVSREKPQQLLSNSFISKVTINESQYISSQCQCQFPAFGIFSPNSTVVILLLRLVPATSNLSSCHPALKPPAWLRDVGGSSQ